MLFLHILSFPVYIFMIAVTWWFFGAPVMGIINWFVKSGKKTQRIIRS